MKFDHAVDVVVVGSGAAALSAAVTAVDKGLSVLVLESTDMWGGSSSLSGGGVWLPNNPLMKRAGAGDSREEALRYLDVTIGEAGPASSSARREAFVDGIEPLVRMLERLGVRFVRAADYPDYYPELDGGKVGRAIEVKPYDAKQIGDWFLTNRGRQEAIAAPVLTDDYWLLQRAWSTASGFVRGAQVVFRTLGSFAAGKRSVGMGVALTSSLLDIALRHGTELWLSSPAEGLLADEDSVVGVQVRKEGRLVSVEARRGVVLAGGGFDHNAEWREKYQGVDGTWSQGASGNLGSAIAVAGPLGAATALMDDAWWGGSVPPVDADDKPAFLVGERSAPHSMIVDAVGDRFANESESYVDLGHHMFEHEEEVPGKYWMIADVRHARKYLRTYTLDPRVNKTRIAAGIFHKAPTLRALAAGIGVDPSRLEASVERFNGFARTGIDQDFGRGNSVYDRYYGDPTCRPNANLGTIEKGPFTALQLVPGDLGTKGGLLTDEHARVLREDGSVIQGLYAAGNTSASVMGRTYPGPGSTLGPAMVFGHLAAEHLAGR